MSSSTHSHAGSRQFPGNCTLEEALKTIVDVFHRHSARQGDLDLLSAVDFQRLLTEQAPSFLSVCVSAGGTSTGGDLGDDSGGDLGMIPGEMIPGDDSWG